MSDNPEGAPPTPAATPEGERGPVPWTRFEQVRVKVETATAEATTAKAEAAAATAARAEIEARYKADAAAWQDERAIMRRGIADEEGVAVVKTLYGMIPPEARPAEGIAGWLGSLTPETAPKSLRPYLASSGQQQAAPPPNANAGATGRSAEQPGQVTIEAYRAARTEAVKRGTLQAFADSPLAKAFEGRT